MYSCGVEKSPLRIAFPFSFISRVFLNSNLTSIQKPFFKFSSDLFSILFPSLPFPSFLAGCWLVCLPLFSRKALCRQ